MKNLKIKVKSENGIEIFGVDFFWGEEITSVESKLSPYFKMYHPKTPDISSIGNRFTKGVEFAHYNIVEIDDNGAEGYDFQLGFNKENKLIEFCSIWNFQLEIESMKIFYCESFNEQVNNLKLNQIELVDLGIDAVLIKKYNIILAKSFHKETYWNIDDVIQYVYINDSFEYDKNNNIN